ncbi:unnamed protein product [Polarella glacialis]|uniref:Transcriptional regulator n=1 Tax=Polarella glacialis TaxID=89957 RepID=A0A813E6Y3_POLGL|nr:unnamed protein product [Polarella glacialis]
MALQTNLERVELRRSLSQPAAAKKRGLATQAYLRCVEKGDLKSLRRIALEANAELSGNRVVNRMFGADPTHLVDSCAHLVPTEQANIKHQYAELPQLIGAYNQARSVSGKVTITGRGELQSDSRATSKDTVRGVSKVPLASSQSMTMLFDVTSPQLKGRTAQAHSTMVRLAGSLSVPLSVAHAAKTQPQLLWTPAKAGEEALAALAKALKNEELESNFIIT